MNPSPRIIEIHGDDVTVEASYLAVRLGLPVDRLRAEMRRGIIYSVVERGVGEDAGRLRLTFRYHARLDGGGPARRDPERGAVVAGVTGQPSAAPAEERARSLDGQTCWPSTTSHRSPPGGWQARNSATDTAGSWFAALMPPAAGMCAHPLAARPRRRAPA